MTRESVTVLGMSLERWTHISCEAYFGVKETWATLYTIQSEEPGKGHATALLIAAKEYYENLGKRFGGSVAVNTAMKSIYRKLGIHEYEEER